MGAPGEAPATVTLVKLGGSLITDKSRPLTPRAETLSRLAEEIFDAGLAGSLVLGHGSGSFGHQAAAEHSVHHGVRSPGQADGVVETQVYAHRLHRLVIDTLWKASVPPYSVAPSGNLVNAAGRPTDFNVEPVTGALHLGLVPVTFGDVVIDREWGASICSTEQVFEALIEGLLASGIGVERVLWLGATDGIYDRDSATVHEIGAQNFRDVLEATGGSEAADVTGGMRLRLETAWRLAQRGIPSWIGNGLVPGRLRDELLAQGMPGTRVVD